MSAQADHAVEAAADGVGAAAAAALARISPRKPQEPLDRSLPGPPLTCTSFHYAPGGDAAAQEFFVCPVSLQPLFDPVQCANGHYCCRSCLAKAELKCPVCRDASASVRVGIGLKSLLDSLRVQCSDCDVALARGRLSHHRDHECSLPCVHGCGATAPRADAAVHEAVCPAVKVACAAFSFGCEWVGLRPAHEAHAAICQFRVAVAELRDLAATSCAEAIRAAAADKSLMLVSVSYTTVHMAQWAWTMALPPALRIEEVASRAAEIVQALRRHSSAAVLRAAPADDAQPTLHYFRTDDKETVRERGPGVLLDEFQHFPHRRLNIMERTAEELDFLARDVPFFGNERLVWVRRYMPTTGPRPWKTTNLPFLMHLKEGEPMAEFRARMAQRLRCDAASLRLAVLTQGGCQPIADDSAAEPWALNAEDWRSMIWTCLGVLTPEHH